MKKYEVAFAVEGYAGDKYDYIGNLECDGLEQDESTGKFWVKNAVAYYYVYADDASEAYRFVKPYFEADDFGELHITNSKLKHVRLGGTYWNEEDLRYMKEVEEQCFADATMEEEFDK